MTTNGPTLRPQASVNNLQDYGENGDEQEEYSEATANAIDLSMSLTSFHLTRNF